jgi:predicted O-methyltransferase YrrM
MGVLRDSELERLLAALHARSDARRAEIESYAAERASEGQRPAEDAAARLKAFRGDKLVALGRDKAELCYQLCRANNARRIVEAGTSYGFSTLYPAAAVRDNIRADYFAFLEDPANGFRTMTLPFAGGLELSVHCRP